MTRRLFWTENGLLLRFVQNYLYIRNFIGICIPSYTDVIVANINKIQRWNRSVFWNISDGVIFLVFLLHFGTVPTMWYFLFFCYILEQFRRCDIFCFSAIFWNSSDGVIIFCFSAVCWNSADGMIFFCFPTIFSNFLDSVVFLLLFFYF